MYLPWATSPTSDPRQSALSKSPSPDVEPVAAPPQLQHSLKRGSCIPDFSGSTRSWYLGKREQRVVEGEAAPPPPAVPALTEVLNPAGEPGPSPGHTACKQMAPD